MEDRGDGARGGEEGADEPRVQDRHVTHLGAHRDHTEQSFEQAPHT